MSKKQSPKPKAKEPEEPWQPTHATKRIRSMVNEDLDLLRTQHAIDQMRARDLIMGDLLHVLKTGFVHEDPEPATQSGYYKYRMEGRTPNSGNRKVRVVVIPRATDKPGLKIVTVMWVDEKGQGS